MNTITALEVYIWLELDKSIVTSIKVYIELGLGECVIT